MEDLLSIVVFPELADRAIVSDRSLESAERTETLGSDGLYRLTPHADHLLSRESIHDMVVLLVVAQSAGGPSPTTDRLYLEATLIVRTPKHGVIWSVVIRGFDLFVVLLEPSKREFPVEAHVVELRLWIGDDVDA